MRYTSDTPAPPLPQSYTAAVQSGFFTPRSSAFCDDHHGGRLRFHMHSSWHDLWPSILATDTWRALSRWDKSYFIAESAVMRLSSSFLPVPIMFTARTHKLLQVRDTEIILRISCFNIYYACSRNLCPQANGATHHVFNRLCD